MEQHSEEWNKAYRIFKDGDEATALKLFTILSSAGDWSGSYMIGYIYQQRGLNSIVKNEISVANHKKSIEWFEKSLSQEEQYLAHYDLAKYFYYGQGGIFDYSGAYKHLIECVSFMSFEIANAPLAYAMLGEMLRLGEGCDVNVSEAKKYFNKTLSFGYVAGYAGLKRIARQEKKYLLVIKYITKGIYLGLKLLFSDEDKLVGIGNEWGSFMIRLK